MGVRLAKPSGRNEKEISGQTGGIGESRTPEDTNPTSPTEGIRVIGGDNPTTGTTQKEKLSGLSSVEVDSAAIPTPKPRKPRKPRNTTPTKKKDGEMTAEMLSSLLGVIFNLVALRAGDHWKLSQGEALALAEPITRILSRHDLVGKAGEYGDYVALVVAVGGIVVPKVMIEMSKPKPNKKEGLRHVEPVRVEGRNNRTTNEPNRETKADGGPGGPNHVTTSQASPVPDSRQHLGQLINPF